MKRLAETQGPQKKRGKKVTRKFDSCKLSTLQKGKKKWAYKLTISPTGDSTIDISPLSSLRDDSFQHDASFSDTRSPRSRSPVLEDDDSVKSALKNYSTQ